MAGIQGEIRDVERGEEAESGERREERRGGGERGEEGREERRGEQPRRQQWLSSAARQMVLRPLRRPLTPVYGHLVGHYPLHIQQVVPTKQSDWWTRNLDRAEISMTARLTHYSKYYSAKSVATLYSSPWQHCNCQSWSRKRRKNRLQNESVCCLTNNWNKISNVSRFTGVMECSLPLQQIIQPLVTT